MNQFGCITVDLIFDDRKRDSIGEDTQHEQRNNAHPYQVKNELAGNA
jgi:hypothetical protein